MDPPLDTNGRSWNSNRYGGDLSGKGTANVRSIVDDGIWGAEISVFERKLARTRGLDSCARCSSLNQFRWKKWRKSTQGRGVEAFTSRLNCRWLHDGFCDKPKVVSHEEDQLLRPGLCAKKDGKAMVLDAHVPYETSAKQLAIAQSDKIKKYAPHGDGFRRYLGCDDLNVDGVVVGASRAITQQMAAKLSMLGLGPGEMDLMQKREVEGSWAIFK